MDEIIFNNHWIKVNEKNQITEAWAEHQAPTNDTSNAILYNDKGKAGGIRFLINGEWTEENPFGLMFTHDGIPRLVYKGKLELIERTEDDIKKERDARPVPKPVITIEARVEHLEKVIEVIADTLPKQAQSEIAKLGAMLDVI